jgi:hypothetical protein
MRVVALVGLFAAFLSGIALGQTTVQHPLVVPVDSSLTHAFLRENLSRTDDTAYNELIGLMTLAFKGESFGTLEDEVRRNAAKKGDNRKAELSRMVLSLRNFVLETRKSEP